MSQDTPLDRALESAMQELTTAFAKPIDVEETLTHVTTAAVDLIDGVDYADVMLINEGQFSSVAPTASLVTDLDHAQMQHGQGPCLEAAVADSVVRSPDLRREERWPAFASAAVEVGVLSSLSFQLYTHRKGAGALNVLSKRPHAFDINTETALAMLATHAAITLIAADKESQFRSALASRDVIGQAKGIVMERFKIDASRAFALITKISQDSNTRLRVIAQQLVDSTTPRDVPEVGE
jgi:transcriptional regulator with GAF, ATPase, and Fis domain